MNLIPDVRKSCVITICSMNTMEPVFDLVLYGFTASEMRCCPPPVSPYDMLQRRGLNPDEFFSSPFLVNEPPSVSTRSRP
jgi:hypothetical protein